MGHTSPEGTGASTRAQGHKPGPFTGDTGARRWCTERRARRSQAWRQAQTSGFSPGAPPPPHHRARCSSDTLATRASWALTVPLSLQEEFPSSQIGFHSPRLPDKREPLMGLLASGADTSLFCSFFPLQLCPPYLVPCTPGRPRTSRWTPSFPAPSDGQARAGEALPAAPLVTSAPGCIPTLGRPGRMG